MTSLTSATSAPAAPAQHGASGTRPFAAYEWMIAGRYLRARRKSGFVSVIALISFLGITVGVMALIVVLSVMNGFHKELLDKIVGVNGHIFLQAADSAADRVRQGRRTRREEACPASSWRSRWSRAQAGVSSHLQPGRRAGPRRHARST